MLLFLFLFCFVFCFSTRPLLQKTSFHAGLWRTPRAQRRVGCLDRHEGRTVCKAQAQFSEVKKPSPEGSRAEMLLTFRRGNNISSHGIRPFSVYPSLLAPGVNYDACFYRLVRPRGAPWYFSTCWPLRWREARMFSFIFFLFCTLPLQPPTCLLCNTVLTSLSGLPKVRWRSRRGLRLGEHEMEQRGGVRDERSPLRQRNRSHFTFCHETKVPSDYKPNREPGVNQHQTHSFHVSSDGLFSTCFSRSTSADGKACSEGGWELCYTWL